MRPSVLIAGDPWIGSTVFSVMTGFQQLGWDVQDVNSQYFVKLKGSLIPKLLHKITRKIDIQDYNKEIIEKVKVLMPTAFLTVKGSYIYAETLEEIRNMGVVTVNYYPDVHFSYENIYFSSFSQYDLFYTTKTFQLEVLKEKLGDNKVFYIPHGYSDIVHRPPNMHGRINYQHDLIYIGSYSQYKKNWLHMIVNNFPSIKLAIYGGGWKNCVNDSKLAEYIVGQELWGFDYCKKIFMSKINFAIHSGVVDKSGWEDLVSTRTFEIPACKGFMLHINNQEVREFYEPDIEIGLFSNANDLCEKIEYYLSNELERLEVIENAFNRCVPAYGYNKRTEEIAKGILNVA